MGKSLKDELRQFADQQYSLFGDIIATNRQNGQHSPPQSAAEQAPMSSAFAQQLSNINEDWVGATSLETLNQMICTCVKCPLGQTRNKFVFGVGNPHADIVVIGEGPGADEDKQGEPFVGAAGQLLNKILAAIHLTRDDVYICNIVKCRPPGNRTPERTEIDTCNPYLMKQLDLIQPRFILALGLTAATTILNRTARLGELRGKPLEAYGVTVIATYHPAALLRNPQWKRSTWEDVQLLRQLYDKWKGSS